MKKNKVFDDCILEMGNMVKLPWESFEDVLAFQKENGETWYLARTWSREEEDQFKDWMRNYLSKNTRWSKSTIEREIGMFVLMYGWKVQNEPI